jgi:hypothetical protein
VTAGSPNSALAGVLGAPGTTLLFGGKGLGTDLTSGARLSLGYWFDDCRTWGVDASGFFLGPNNNRFSAQSFGNPVLARPIIDVSPVVNQNGVVVPNPAQGQEAIQAVTAPGLLSGGISVARKSTLWGADINLNRQCWCCENGYLTLLGGFRYLGLDESLDITESLLTGANTGVPGTVIVVNDHFATSNRFYGGQLGAAGEYRLGCWSFAGKAKVALGVTQQWANITGFTTQTLPGGTPQTLPGGLLALQGTNMGVYSRNNFSVVPELGLTVGYQIKPWCRVTAGYNFLYWSSVIRPGGLIDRAVNATYQPFSPVPPTGSARPMPLFNTTDFWAQGVTFGVEFYW